MYGDLTMSYEAIKSPSLAQSQYNLVQVFVKQERWQEAIEACGQVIDLDPVFVPAYQTLGEILNQRGDWEAAVKCYQKAIELKPNFAEFYHGLGLALSKLEKWADAAQALSKATELNPDFSWSHNSLGEVLLRLQKWEEGARALRKAIDLNPDFGWSYFNLGEALSKLQDWDGAVHAYRSASELQPDLPNIKSKLGNALQQQSNPDSQAALNCYLEGIKHNPDDEQAYLKALEIKNDDAELYVQYGDSLVKQNRASEAIFAYYLAIQTQPNNIEFHLKLGRNLIAQGQLDHAINCYHRALKFNPGVESVQLALGEALVKQQQFLDRETNDSFQRVRKLGENHQNIIDSQLKPTFKLEGCLEEVDGCLLKGWAFNSLNPDETLTLIVYQNGQEIMQVIADRFRKDLKESVIGTGNHGFSVRLPQSSCEAAPFDLQIKVKNSDFVLHQSDISFEYKPEYKTSFQGHCEAINGTKFKGWALDNNNLDRKVKISVYEGSKLLTQVVSNIHRADIQQWKKGDGRFGFMFELPEQILDNQAHQLSFCFENSHVEVTNSPQILEEGWLLSMVLDNLKFKLNKINNLLSY